MNKNKEKGGMQMNRRSQVTIAACAVAMLTALGAKAPQARAQTAAKKPNIILIVSDDFGYGDAGVYGGGPNRGMPTPQLDRIWVRRTTRYRTNTATT
jgi:hypothetical protein